MNRRAALAGLSVLVVGCGHASAPARTRDPALREALEASRTRFSLVGASAAVIFPDGASWQGASGPAAPDTLATPATAFELGSVTKMYTAAVVLQLVAENRVRLDDALSRWFPQLQGADAITLTHLLNHTHGLHDPLQDPGYIPAVLQDPTRVWTLDDILRRMGAPHFAPGAGWRYSNTGYHLLGAVVEAETGGAFADALHARLFAPLGLADTWYGQTDPAGAAVAAAYIDPSGAGAPPQPISLMMPWTAFRSSAGPAGAIVATASDAARYLHALVNGSVLAESEWRRMTDWLDRPDGNRYGLGLLRIESDGEPLLGHKGNSAGYSAAAFHHPQSEITVAVLTNTHAVDVAPVATALLRAGLADERRAR